MPISGHGQTATGRCAAQSCAVTLLKTAFWASAGLLVYTHAGYPAALAALDRLRARARTPHEAPTPLADAQLPGVSVIVAAYAEQAVIADRVANLRALDYPADRLEVIVACDGSPDDTAQSARAAGADVVLDLPRGGKVRAQDAGVRHARHEITAFSDANVAGRPTRCGASSRRSPILRSATSVARCVRQRARDKPGGPVLAL